MCKERVSLAADSRKKPLHFLREWGGALPTNPCPTVYASGRVVSKGFEALQQHIMCERGVTDLLPAPCRLEFSVILRFTIVHAGIVMKEVASRLLARGSGSPLLFRINLSSLQPTMLFCQGPTKTTSYSWSRAQLYTPGTIQHF